MPLLLACLAGLYSERAGIFDIGLEGKMLAARLRRRRRRRRHRLGLARACSPPSSSRSCFALVHGFASITQRGNQIVSGVAINFVAAGSTIILGQAWFRQGGRTPSLAGAARFGAITCPSPTRCADVPVLGPIYSELISGHSILVYVAFLMVPLTWWVLYRTRFGLRLRAVGENPAAVDTAGISVAWLRYRAVICAGVLCRHRRRLSVDRAERRLRQGHDGRQGLHRARRADLRQVEAGAGACSPACCSASSMPPSIRLQGMPLPVIGKVPVQFIQALPYILTVILLAGFIGKADPAQGRRRALCEGTLMTDGRRDLFEAARDGHGQGPCALFELPGRRGDPHRGRPHLCRLPTSRTPSYPEGWCAETTAHRPL